MSMASANTTQCQGAKRKRRMYANLSVLSYLPTESFIDRPSDFSDETLVA